MIYNKCIYRSEKEGVYILFKKIDIKNGNEKIKVD